ncbi:MAG TPA: hypothetical protein VNP96_06830 [Solirubrobacterales bacterium]|nr:hypothetical protein [Solirubrobacterales bacterium]
MASDHPTGCAERDSFTPADEDGKVERAVLSFLLDDHAGHQLTIPEVSRAMNAGRADFRREDAVERAIRELDGAGLLHCRGGFAAPTRAALYFARLWEL